MSDWESDLARQRRNFEKTTAARAPSGQETDPGLKMWDQGLAVAVLLAMVGGLGAIAVGYWVVGELVAVSDRAISPAQRFTAAFAVATALGALVALVVSVRKQNLAEQLARREITAAFTERFRSAAEQLGGKTPAERLAGVYAMAALADDYPTRRQQCVNVLCGYLRLPFDPATDHLADRSVTTTQAYQDGSHTTHQNFASRPFDQQVRETIVTVIHDHTKPDAPVSWSALDLNLEGAHLTNVDLSHAVFSGRRTSFGGATFSGKHTWFGGAEFSGERTSFEGATFSGEHTWFDGAEFSGGYTWFDGAEFSGECTWFGGATFSGEHTWFDGATFSGQRTWFDAATFSGGVTSFDGAEFCGEHIWFDGAEFCGKHVSFDGATFSRGVTSFDDAVFENGTRVLGLEEPVLVDGAQIVRNGEPFRGWPLVTHREELS